MNATAPQLYSHIGNNGEAFWSPVPPNGACEGAPPPIYYEPMCVEEPSPEPDLRMARSASRADRLVCKIFFHSFPEPSRVRLDIFGSTGHMAPAQAGPALLLHAWNMRCMCKQLANSCT